MRCGPETPRCCTRVAADPDLVIARLAVNRRIATPVNAE